MVILSEPVADIEEALTSLRVVSVGNTALSPSCARGVAGMCTLFT